LVVHQFEYAEGVWSCLSLNTPKAFANFSPGLEQPWVSVLTNRCNAESVGELCASVGQRFQRCVGNTKPTQGCSNPGLKLANAFGVIQTETLPKICVAAIGMLRGCMLRRSLGCGDLYVAAIYGEVFAK
jgi:hypothetical protein